MKKGRRSLWIIKQYAVSPDMPGNTRHFELGRRLVQRGYEVTIIATSFHYSQHREIRLEKGKAWKAEEVDSVKFVWIRTFPFSRNDWRRVVHMLSFLLRSYRVGRRLPKLASNISKPDVIIGCSVPPFAALAGYWLSRHYKSRFFFEVGDLWPQTLIDMGALSEKHPFTKVLQALERYLYLRSEWIISPLRNASDYIHGKYGVPTRKVVWIPNGVDSQSFNSLRKTLASEDQFIVIYTGVHSLAASLDKLVRAAKNVEERGFKGIRFVLVGDGPEKPRLQRLASELKLDNVEFRDSVPRTEIPQLLLGASAAAFILNEKLLQQTRYGVGGKKMSEYLAAGLPIIFAAVGSPNPVEEAECGVAVAPGNAKALAEAIIQLYQLPESERRAMGERGRKYAEEHYDWSRLTDRLESCIGDPYPGVEIKNE